MLKEKKWSGFFSQLAITALVTVNFLASMNIVATDDVSLEEAHIEAVVEGSFGEEILVDEVVGIEAFDEELVTKYEAGEGAKES